MAPSNRDVVASPPDPTPFILAQIASGNEQCSRELIDGWETPITTIASRYASRHSDLDDLVQVGRIAVYTAALKYGPHHGTPFSHYAKRAIRNRVLREVARLKRQRKGEAALDAVTNDVPVPMPEPQEQTDLLVLWTRELLEPHRTIFQLLYVQGLTQRAAAQRVQKSQPRVSQMHQSLLDLAREYLRA